MNMIDAPDATMRDYFQGDDGVLEAKVTDRSIDRYEHIRRRDREKERDG